MDKPQATKVREIAEAASIFEQRQTGHKPGSVDVVLGDGTLMTLHEALSPAKVALSRDPAAAWVQDFTDRPLPEIPLLAGADSPPRIVLSFLTATPPREGRFHEAVAMDARPGRSLWQAGQA